MVPQAGGYGPDACTLHLFSSFVELGLLQYSTLLFVLGESRHAVRYCILFLRALASQTCMWLP
jgi:hypothetical protein